MAPYHSYSALMLNHLRWLTVSLATAFTLLAAQAEAATINVDTQADTLADDGHCSLREAVNAANSDAASGGCAAGSGADTIVLPAGIFDLSIAGAGEDANATGDLDATSDIALTGAGAAHTVIRAVARDRILDVAAGNTVSVADLTMTGGHAPDGAPGGPGTAGVNGGPGVAGTNGQGENGTPGESGGSILNAGTLSVADAVIKDSQGGNGGDGHSGTGGDGGSGADGGHG